MGEFADVTACLGPSRVRDLGGGLRVAELLDPSQASPEAVARLYHSLEAVADESFGGDRDWEAYFDGELHAGMFQARDRFFIIGDATDAIVGWSGYWMIPLRGRHVLLVDTTGVAAKYRGQRVLTRVYLHAIGTMVARRPWRPLSIVGFTQNPVVYTMQLRALGGTRVHPRPNEPVPAGHAEVAATVAQWRIEWARAMGRTHPMSFETDTSVMRGTYAARTDAEPRPTSGRADVDDWFADRLGPGDMFVVVSEAGLFDCVRIGVALARRRARSRASQLPDA